jgi:small subunit ribosomal protein S2
MSEVDIKKLFEAGAHFGHKTSRWNPKMAGYIHSKQGDSHIINLEKTVTQLDEALAFLTEVAKNNRQILFVGTKKQARDIIRTAAESIEQPFVTERWLGGMLTNSATMSSQVKKLKLLEKRMASGELANRYNKLEVQRFQEEIDALNVKYGGVKDSKGRPGALFVISATEDKNAVAEAAKLGIPIVAICDTNADPTLVTYPIPANDDAIAAIQLITDHVVAAIREGINAAPKKEDKTAAKPTAMAAKTENSEKTNEEKK